MNLSDVREVIDKVERRYNVDVKKKKGKRGYGSSLFSKVIIYNIIVSEYGIHGTNVSMCLSIDRTTGLHYKKTIDSFFYEDGFLKMYKEVELLIKDVLSNQIMCVNKRFKPFTYVR